MVVNAAKFFNMILQASKQLKSAAPLIKQHVKEEPASGCTVNKVNGPLGRNVEHASRNETDPVMLLHYNLGADTNELAEECKIIPRCPGKGGGQKDPCAPKQDPCAPKQDPCAPKQDTKKNNPCCNPCPPKKEESPCSNPCGPKKSACSFNPTPSVHYAVNLCNSCPKINPSQRHQSASKPDICIDPYAAKKDSYVPKQPCTPKRDPAPPKNIPNESKPAVPYGNPKKEKAANPCCIL